VVLAFVFDNTHVGKGNSFFAVRGVAFDNF
jgi:hypothetical protein